MTTNPLTSFPSGVNPSSPQYPYGEPRNNSGPSTTDGTPWEANFIKDLFSMVFGMLTQTGQTPSGAPDSVTSSQVLNALSGFVAAADFYTDDGVANDYALTTLLGRAAPPDYLDGMRVRFVPTVANAGPVTVTVDGLTTQNVYKNGAAMTGGEFIAGVMVTLVYDASNSRFNVQPNFFQQLTDGPGLFSGQGGKFVAVNVGETALEYTASAGGVSTLDDLTDVEIVSPTDGEALLYDGGAALWKNLPSPVLLNFVKATSGYAEVNGGALGSLLIQWGTKSVSGEGTGFTVTLPTGFTSSVSYGLAIVADDSNDTHNDNFAVNSKAAGSFRITSGISGTRNVYWIAIGY